MSYSTTIRFTGLNRAMAVLGARRSNSDITIGDRTLVVRMGWLFRAEVPLSAVRSAGPETRRMIGWGVHGWRGRWLVNGSITQLVRIDIDPEVRARVCGVPVRLRELIVSADDPDGLVVEISRLSGPRGRT